MPITRLYSYTPGSLAEGDKVQGEFDAIISFINGLEIDKLDAVGGDVSDLHVLSTLEVDGLATFSAGLDITGDSTLDGDLDITSTKHLTLGDLSELRVGDPIIGVKIKKTVMNLDGSAYQVIFGPGTNGIDISNAVSGVFGTTVALHNTNGLSVGASGTTLVKDVVIRLGGAGGGRFEVSKSSPSHVDLSVQMTGLPTSNPGGSGLLWNNAGVLNIT